MASQQPLEPVPESSAALWLAVGRLQSDVARLIEGQSDFRSDLAGTNRRIDRLFYDLVGVGAAVIGTLVAVLLRGG